MLGAVYDPSMRVLTVLELLQARESVTGPELARRLEVSLRTVQRYVARLQDLGIPVQSSRGVGGAYRLRPGFRLPPLMLEQIQLLQRSANETAEAMARLKTLRDLEPYWIEVNRLENEADRVYRKLLSKLFSGDYDALTMVKLREVADGLEEAADALEHVAHAVETIAVKES